MATSLGSQIIADVGNITISTALYLQVLVAWLESVDLLSLCVDLGNINGSGSLSHKVGVWNPSNLEASAVGEGTAITLADPADTTFTITVAKQAAAVGQTDELYVISPQGYGFEQFQPKLIERANMQATDLVCTAGAAFTGGTVGGAVNMTVSLLFDAYFTFDALKPPGGQAFCVLSDTQYRQLMGSFRAEGNGNLIHDPNSRISQALNLMQGGYKGTVLNSCHVINTNRVTTSGGQYKGFMFGLDSMYYRWADVGGLQNFATGPTNVAPMLGAEMRSQWAMLQAQGIIMPNVAPPPITLLLEYDRRPITGETVLVCRAMFGVACDPAKGVLISSST